MNEQLVINAANQVRRLRSVLRWLDDYGYHIGVGDDATRVAITPLVGSSVSGVEDARDFLSSYVVGILPEIVAKATKQAHLDLEAAMRSIHKEVAPLVKDPPVAIPAAALLKRAP